MGLATPKWKNSCNNPWRQAGAIYFCIFNSDFSWTIYQIILTCLGQNTLTRVSIKGLFPRFVQGENKFVCLCYQKYVPSVSRGKFWRCQELSDLTPETLIPVPCICIYTSFIYLWLRIYLENTRQPFFIDLYKTKQNRYVYRS